MEKRNWTNKIFMIMFIIIFLISAVLIGTNKSMVDQKIEIATANTQNQKESLEIWTIEGDIQKVVEEILPIYKKAYPDIQIKLKVFKSNIYQEMLLNASRTNGLPDIFYSWGDQRLEDLVALDLIADVTETVQVQVGDLLYDNTLESYTFDNKVYGLPIWGWNNILYCNTELFDTCGLSVPTTYDEFLEVVKAFKSQGVTPLIIGGADSWTASLYFMELVLAKGDMSTVEALKQNPSFFRSHEFLEAASDFKALIDLEPWQAGYETISNPDALNDFVKGKGAMMLLGSWSNVEIENVLYSLIRGKVEAINFPRENINEVGIGGYADGFVLNKNTEIEGIDVQKLFVDLVKEISDRSIEIKGLGIPVYKDQDIEDTRHRLLKQCHTALRAKSYHQAYDQILEYNFVKQYDKGLYDFIQGNVSEEEFIQKVIQGEKEYDD